MAMVEAYIGEGVSMNGGRIRLSLRKVAHMMNRHAIEGRATFTKPTTRSGVIWKVGC